MIRIAILLFTIISSAQNLLGQKLVTYYLSKEAKGYADGSIQRPFSDIKQVQQAIKKSAPNRNIRIVVRKGVYELSEPLTFKVEDSRDSAHFLEILSFPGEQVTFSGGKKLIGKWIKTNKPDVWELTIPNFSRDSDIFRSLFLDGKRLQRATSDTLYSKGPLSKYSKLYHVLDFAAIRRLIKDSINVFSGFEYSNGDLNTISDIASAEVIAYNSWEASWHSILKIDQFNNSIYFKNPATYPVGFFGPKIRYRVENLQSNLDEVGEWQLDYQTGKLLYFANKNENPNKLDFIYPRLKTILNIIGDVEKGKVVRNIKFVNINFSYSSSAWGANNISLQDQVNNSRLYPWVNFKEGFSSVQASLDCGEAVLLKGAENCAFVKCSFTHLGNYAIRVGEFSKGNIISNCTIADIGGGGIIIGFNRTGGKRDNIPYRMSPTLNKITSCSISDCGKIFPSGVGIGIMQANNTTVSGNRIYNLPYTGISVGWSYSFEDTYTSHNVIIGNYIHDVMKILADGAGIYTLGKQTGSIYKNNVIRNVYRAKNAIGSSNNGFFFDQGSSDFLVDSNAVINVKNQDYRFNQTDSTRIKIKTNYFEKSKINKNILDTLNQKFKLTHSI